LIFSQSGALVVILDADDIVLAEIAAGLNLDQFQQYLARIFQPVDGADRDIDRFVLVHGLSQVGELRAETGLFQLVRVGELKKMNDDPMHRCNAAPRCRAKSKRTGTHCGLEWDDACAKFYQSKRPVTTPSRAFPPWRKHGQPVTPRC
jgi:hypothetical protein